MAVRDVTAFHRLARIAEAIQALNNATAQTIQTVFNNYYRYLELDLTLFRQLVDNSQVLNALLAGQEYSNLGEVQTVFSNAVASQYEAEELARQEIEAVGAVNAATIENIGIALFKYAQVIGLDFTDYNTLTTEEKASVLAAVVGGQPYADVASIKATFDGAVEAILNPES